MSNPTLGVKDPPGTLPCVQTHLGVLERLRIHVLILGERVDMGALCHMLGGLVDSGGHVCGTAAHWQGHGKLVGGQAAWVLQRSTAGVPRPDTGAGRAAALPASCVQAPEHL